MNDTESKLVEFVGRTGGKTPMEVLKEIELAIVRGEVEDIMIVVRKPVGETCRLRWSSSETRWENKAAMASFLFATVNA